MIFLDLLLHKKTAIYSLSLKSGKPKTALNDIISGKSDIYQYRKAICIDSALIDYYSDQINSSINVTKVENIISKETTE